MGAITYMVDRLTNFVAELGTSRDKSASTHYGTPVISDAELENAYRGAWLPRKIVDIPALDATRNWREWQADPEQITAIEEEERRLGLRPKLQHAKRMARLFGGAAILVGTGENDPSRPLLPRQVGRGGVQYLNVLTRRQLTAAEIEDDVLSPGFGRPRFYTYQSTSGQVDIHPSRLVLLTGNDRPDDLMGQSDPLTHGWGDSVLLSCLDQVKQADGTSANVASLVYEALVDVIRVPDFTAGMADPDYRKRLLDRMRLAAIAKGNNGMLLLDKEEEYDRKQIQFSGLTDLILTMLQVVSGAADIPVTRMLGQSPGGLNSTGESDRKNYYDRVKAIQELELRPAMSTLDECLIRSALGDRPDEVHYNWASLWQVTQGERTENFGRIARGIKEMVETRVWPDEALRDAATNALVEMGLLPGLEQAMKDYADLDGRLAENEPEEGEEDV